MTEPTDRRSDPSPTEPYTPPPPREPAAWSEEPEPPQGVPASSPSAEPPPTVSAAPPPGPPPGPQPGWSAAPPAWTPPQQPRPARTGPDVGSLVFGLILLAIGVWFLAEVTLGIDLPTIRWGQLWPVILIVLGGWILYTAARRR